MVAASLATAFALLATGTIKTDPVELIYSVHDAEKIYDGTPLTATDYRLTKGELLPGHTAQVEILGSQTSVGTSLSDLSVKVYDAQGYNVTSSYAIKVINGELTVGKKSVKIKMPSQKVVYNGSKVLFEEYTVADSASSLVNGHKIYGSTEAKLMNVGDTLPNDLKPLVFDVAGNEVTENYDIDFEIGEIEVIPRPVSVRPVSYEKVYDGKAMFAEEYEFVEGSLVEGQWAEYEINKNYDNGILDAGELETSVTSFRIYELVNGEKTDVTKNYDVSTHETGLLKVTPRPLTVYAPDKTWIYDGSEHNLEGEQTVRSEGLAETDEILAVTFSGRITDVGREESRVNTITVNCSDKNYTVTSVSGVLEVTPYELTVTTATDEQYYNGEELWNSSLELSTPYGVGALANAEHDISILLNAEYPKIVDAGSISNEYECRIFAKNGASVTQNYAITYVYGTLTVKKMPVAVTLGVEEITYDGEVHTPDISEESAGRITLRSVDGSELGIGADDFETVSSARVMQDAKEYSYTVRFADKANYNNYDLEILNTGYYKINERKVTVGTLSKDRPYNGLPLTHGAYELLDGTSLAANQRVAVPAVLPSITDYGKLTNEFKVSVFDAAGADVTKNYAVTYSYGELEITARAVNVQLGSLEHQFNNRNYVVKPQEAVTVSFDGEVEGGLTAEEILSPNDFSIIYYEDILHVKYDEFNLLASYKYSAEIADKRFAKNFVLNVTDGRVKVNPRPVEAKIKDVSTTYNGDEYVLDQYTAITEISDTTTGLSRDDFKVTFADGKSGHTDYAASGYSYTVEINEDKKGDYKLTVKNFANPTRANARLTINKYRVTITSGTASYVYNGQSQVCSDFTNTALVRSDHKIFVTNLLSNTVRQENVGSKPNALEYKICVVSYTIDADGIKEKQGEEVTGNYEIVPVNGTITVTRRPITLTTASVKITYDGVTEARSGGVTANEGALVSGHTPRCINVDDLPSITEAGEIENRFSCEIVGVGDVTENYEISYAYGTLLVEKRKVTLQTSSVSKLYDTEEITGGDLTLAELTDADGNVITNEFAAGHSAIIADETKAPKLTDVGFVENKFDYVIVDGENTDVTKNYECEVLWGTFEIKPRTVVLKLNNFVGDADDEYNFVKTALTYNGKEQAETVANDAIGLVDFLKAEGEYLTPADKANLSGKLSYVVDFYEKTVMDAGSYYYTVVFADSVNTENFILSVERAKITVNKMSLDVRLSNLNFDFDDTVKSFKPTDKFGSEYVVGAVINNSAAVTDDSDVIGYDTEEGAYASDALLVRSDFVIYAEEEMRYVKYLVGDDGEERITSYKYTVKFADKTKESNFVIEETTGSVTIKPKELVLDLKNYYVDYSGEEFKVNPEEAVKVTNSMLLSGRNFTVAPSAAILNVNDNAFAEKEEDRGYYSYTVSITDESYAKNFTIKPVKNEAGEETEPFGKVTVKPLKVGVYLKKYVRTYDDKEYKLAPTDAIVTDSRLLTVDKFDLKVRLVKDGTETAVTQIKDAGSYIYTAELNDAKDKKNFVLQAVENLSRIEEVSEGGVKVTRVAGGEVTVNKFEVQLSLANLTHTYNGIIYNLDAHKNEAITNIVDTDLITENDLVLEFEENQLDKNDNPADFISVGSYTYKVTVKASMKDKEGNFKFVCNKACVNIVPREITIFTKGESKIFDGEILQLGGEEDVWAEEGALIAGHKFVFDGNTAPMISEVGSVKNEFEIDIQNGRNESVVDNYIVTFEYGELTVTARPITVKTGTIDKVYDGSAVTDGTPVVIGMDDLTGYEVKPVDEDKIPVLTGVGSADNVFLCKVVTNGTDEDGNEIEIDASANFAVTYEYGTLSVTERKVTAVVYSGVEMTYLGKVLELKVTDFVRSVSVIIEDNDELPDDQLFALAALTDLCVDCGSAVVKNAGSYGYVIRFADESYAKNFEISFVNEDGTASDGSGLFTVNRLGVHIVMANVPVQSAYNGSVQTIPLTYTDEDGYEYSTVNPIIPDPDFGYDLDNLPEDFETINPDGFSGSDFKIVYSESMLNAKIYSYSIEFKNSVWYQNYELLDADRMYEILRLEVELDFSGLKLTYNGKDQTSAVTAGMKITGDGASYLSASDFVAVCDTEMINAGDYECQVKFVNFAVAQNYYFAYDEAEDGKLNAEYATFNVPVTVAQRKVALKLNTVYVSAAEWEVNGGAGGEYTVKDELCIDSSYSVAEGDRFTVNKAIGYGDESGNIELDISAGALDYAFLDSEGNDVSGNYEVTNEGVVLTARLIGLSA